MGQCLCADTRSLASYGVVHSGATAFLYLLSAQQARLSRQLFQKDQETAVLHPSSSNTTSSTSSSNKTKNNKTAMPDLSPKTNPHPKPNPNPNTNSNPSPSLPTPGVADHDWRGYSTLPCRLNHSSTSMWTCIVFGTLTQTLRQREMHKHAHIAHSWLDSTAAYGTVCSFVMFGEKVMEQRSLA